MTLASMAPIASMVLMASTRPMELKHCLARHVRDATRAITISPKNSISFARSVRLKAASTVPASLGVLNAIRLPTTSSMTVCSARSVPCPLARIAST